MSSIHPTYSSSATWRRSTKTRAGWASSCSSLARGSIRKAGLPSSPGARPPGCWTWRSVPTVIPIWCSTASFRFELQREIAGAGAPYRQALVRLIEEPWFNEQEVGVLAVRQTIVELLRSLCEELGEKLPLDVDDLASGDCPYEELVNRVACRVDLPAVRKLQLLTESLLERGLSVLSILRSRRQVLDMLRPYRRLADGSERN